MQYHELRSSFEYFKWIKIILSYCQYITEYNVRRWWIINQSMEFESGFILISVALSLHWHMADMREASEYFHISSKLVSVNVKLCITVIMQWGKALRPQIIYLKCLRDWESHSSSNWIIIQSNSQNESMTRTTCAFFETEKLAQQVM